MKVVDTIAAIATASGNSGIGIIRVSGDEAVEIVDKIFKSVNSDKKLVNVKSHTINYGHIVDNDKVIDEVLVSVMNGPRFSICRTAAPSWTVGTISSPCLA